MHPRMGNAVDRFASQPNRPNNQRTLAVPSVLVAEDDPASLTLIVHFLERLGLRNPLVSVADGDAAVDRLANMDPAPVVALLDLNMPGRTGLEVLRWIREQPRFDDLEVVLLTGVTDTGDINEAHRLGVASYLVKPVGYEALGDVLRGLGLPWSLHHGDAPNTTASAGRTGVRR